jgi:PKD domain
VHTYPYLAAGGGGWERQVVANVNLAAGANPRNFELRRGWALVAGGGSIAAFTGPDFSNFGCGAVGAIDGRLGSGWASAPGGTVTIQLPATIDVTGFEVDPGAICGDPANAGTNQFQIATAAAVAGPYTTAAAGGFTLGQGGAMNPVTPTAGTNDVRFVRFTVISNHGNANNFADVAEIAVHGIEQGNATAAIDGSATIELGTTVTYTDASTGVGNSPIVSRTWSGAATGTGTSVAINGNARGPLSLTINVTDFAGRAGSTTKALTVVDTTKPKVAIRKASGRVGRAVKIQATMSDLSGFSGKATVRFGDGKAKKVTIRNGKISVTHRYTKAKLYTVSVTVKDKAGNTTKVSRKVRIKK